MNYVLYKQKLITGRFFRFTIHRVCMYVCMYCIDYPRRWCRLKFSRNIFSFKGMFPNCFLFYFLNYFIIPFNDTFAWTFFFINKIVHIKLVDSIEQLCNFFSIENWKLNVLQSKGMSLEILSTWIFFSRIQTTCRRIYSYDIKTYFFLRLLYRFSI